MPNNRSKTPQPKPQRALAPYIVQTDVGREIGRTVVAKKTNRASRVFRPANADRFSKSEASSGSDATAQSGLVKKGRRRSSNGDPVETILIDGATIEKANLTSIRPVSNPVCAGSLATSRGADQIGVLFHGLSC